MTNVKRLFWRMTILRNAMRQVASSGVYVDEVGGWNSYKLGYVACQLLERKYDVSIESFEERDKHFIVAVLGTGQYERVRR